MLILSYEESSINSFFLKYRDLRAFNIFFILAIEHYFGNEKIVGSIPPELNK